MSTSIPPTQTVALVRAQAPHAPVEFVDDYPTPQPGPNDVLAKILYTGVCQSDLHTKNGTAAGADGKNITNIKFPHVGGHEGVARIILVGQGGDPSLLNRLVGVRFISKVCRRCEFCIAGQEQHCQGGMTNHLHHEDGAFQEYITLDAGNLTLLPDDIDPREIGPVLCAGVTAYKGVMSSGVRPGQWMVVVGAGGGLGHLAIQYARVIGAQVIAIDGEPKREFCLSLGVTHFIPHTTPSLEKAIYDLTLGGAHAVVVCSGSAAAYAHAADLLRIGGTLVCCGIPPGTPYLETSVGKIAIKGLKVVGCLVGSMKEAMEAVELTRLGMVKPRIVTRDFRELEQVYEDLEKDRVLGRVVLKIAKDE